MELWMIKPVLVIKTNRKTAMQLKIELEVPRTRITVKTLN